MCECVAPRRQRNCLLQRSRTGSYTPLSTLVYSHTLFFKSLNEDAVIFSSILSSIFLFLLPISLQSYIPSISSPELVIPSFPTPFLPSSNHLLLLFSLQEIKKEAKRDGGQTSLIRSDLANGRASPVSDPGVRPGRKGTLLLLSYVDTYIHTSWSLGSFKSSGSNIDPISVREDLGTSIPQPST